jgi:hypothetical protein
MHFFLSLSLFLFWPSPLPSSSPFLFFFPRGLAQPAAPPLLPGLAAHPASPSPSLPLSVTARRAPPVGLVLYLEPDLGSIPSSTEVRRTMLPWARMPRAPALAPI